MAKKPGGSTKVTALRRQAEEALRTTRREVEAMPVKDVQQLVHELQVHQIELEMQNDELRRTQMELETARDRYMNLYDFSPVGYLTLNFEGKVVEANLRAGTMLGIDRKKLIGQPLALSIASDDQDIFRRHCQDVMKTGTRQVCEMHLRETSGAPCCIYLESLAVQEESGPITRWRTAMLDISDRKQEEQKLASQQAQLEGIISSAMDAIITVDEDERVVVFNRNATSMFLCQAADVIGQPFDRFIPERFRRAHHGYMSRFTQTGATFRSMGQPGEIFGLRANGEEFPIEASISHVRVNDKDLLTIILRDITERKRAEETLQKSEEQYRSIFENAIEGIFQTTLDGTYIAANPALARMYGYDSPEHMISTITDISSQLYVDPGRREVFIRLMQENAEVAGFEALVYRKDGSSIWVSENVRTRRDQAGLLIGYEGTTENITARKLSEERLRTTLEEVRLLSGSLATVQEEERTRIARELHDELGVRLTCLKIDLSRLQAVGSDETGAGASKKTRGMIPSMIEQINETIASVQRLVMELRPIALDDLGLVAAIEWQCQDFQNRTGIPCTCVTSADDIAMEPERATALFRICQEALTNIARHAHATAVTVKLESRCDFFHLMVADNGVGISDTNGSDRRSFGLLGMRERVALFGGELSIRSDPEQGTTVTVCLPRRQP